MQRPALSAAISVEVFRQWYWLKRELQAFCRAQHLRTGGGKLELCARIEAHLGGEAVGLERRSKSSSVAMPQQLTASTVIEDGWRMSQALRGYFESVHGPGFKFNGAMRDFIGNGAGRTLAEASQRYRESLTEPTETIGRQFEYNRHVRAFYATNPGATRALAIASWWAKRGQPRDGDPSER